MHWDRLSGTLFGGHATPWQIQKPILGYPNAVGKCERQTLAPARIAETSCPCGCWSTRVHSSGLVMRQKPGKLRGAGRQLTFDHVMQQKNRVKCFFVRLYGMCWRPLTGLARSKKTCQMWWGTSRRGTACSDRKGIAGEGRSRLNSFPPSRADFSCNGSWGLYN